MDDDASPTMVNSLMYKMSYYRFSEADGMDKVRRQKVTRKIELRHLEEVYTTEHWLVRIYKVKPLPNHRHYQLRSFP